MSRACACWWTTRARSTPSSSTRCSPALRTRRSGGGQAAVELGTGVASAGDVNGDGFDDLIVTAPFYDLGEFNEGAAFLFFGSPSGIGNGSPATADAVIQGDQAI